MLLSLTDISSVELFWQCNKYPLRMLTLLYLPSTTLIMQASAREILVCLNPPQTVFVGGYTVFTLSDRVSEMFLCPKRFCVRNILFL